jgi:signal transduction histidine kinase
VSHAVSEGSTGPVFGPAHATRRSVDRLLGLACVVFAVAGGAVVTAMQVRVPTHRSLAVDIAWGDALTLVALGALLIARESVLRFGARHARAAALEERKRIARDLHDGVAQELIFIQTRARLAQNDCTERWVGDVADAAERAVAEVRSALTVLSNPSASLTDTLLAAAEDVACRAGVSVRMEAEGGIEPSSVEARTALARMVREAVTNAVRHGGAKTITIRLERDHEAATLTISDDGQGFDPVAAERRQRGLGLRSLRARALELGGHARVESSPGTGSSVVVVVP